AVDDYAIARGQPRGDDPRVALPVAQAHRTRLGLALVVDDVDELALGAFEHRALRHEHRGRALRALERDADDLPGVQQAGGIRKLGAGLARSGLAGDADIREVHLAGLAVYAAVGELEGHVELAVLGQHQLAGFDLAREPQPLLVRDAEEHVDRIDLRHGGEQRVGSRHVVALGTLRAARDTGHRRFDARVAQVELSVGDVRARGLDLRFGDLLDRHGLVIVLLARGPHLVQRLQSGAVAFRLGELRLRARERRLGPRGGDLEGRRVDDKHQPAFPARSAFP